MTLRRRSGMTLVEIIFALAIVSTVLTLAYAAALGAWRNATAASQRTQAQYMIQQTVEALKAYRESDDFVWSDFITEINTVGTPMHIGLEQADGTVTPNDYSCSQVSAPPAGNQCHFVLQSGQAHMTPVGANVLVASNDVIDITITPQAYFTAGNPGENAIAGPLPNNTTAITFVVRAEWNDANGIASNAAVSTIITEPR